LFDADTSTLTVFDTVLFWSSPLQVKVNVYVLTSDRVSDSVPEDIDLEPSQSPLPEHPIALVVVQLKSTESPDKIEVDEEEKLLITGLKIDGNSGDEELPPPPLQETTKNKKVM